jgi:hypothetical protein
MSRPAAHAPAFTCALPACGVHSAKVTAVCAQCSNARYCNRDCQKTHWKVHKKECMKHAKNIDALSQSLFSKPAAPAAAAKPQQQSEEQKGSDNSEAAPTIADLIAAEKGASSSSSAPAEPWTIRPITFSLPSSVAPSHPLLEVKEITNRGRGFVATRDIEPGELLLEEEAIYAHSEGVSAHEEQRIATLAALTKIMLQQFPAALEKLCQHADHELPDHELVNTPPEGITVDAWKIALAQVDSNQFSSARGMMCSPAVSITNHSCYPNADLIIREVPTAGAASSSSSSSAQTVERAKVYAIEPIAAGSEVTINYLGSDSLCRWYAPSMIRQESFTSQWQFTCDCSRCTGTKAKAIDKTISYTPDGMNEEMEQRYTKLVLADGAPQPVALLELYRDIFQQFNGEQYFFNSTLHQIRTMLIFMPTAFDERLQAPLPPAKPRGAGSKLPAAPPAPPRGGPSEFLQMVTYHIRTLTRNALSPPRHSIKSDTVAVVLKACDFIGQEWASKNADKDGSAVEENVLLRKKVIAIAHDCDPTYFEDEVWRKIYPETYAMMAKYGPPEDVE